MCLPCPPGHFANEPGAAACRACERGRLQSVFNSNAFSSCDAFSQGQMQLPGNLKALKGKQAKNSPADLFPILLLLK